MTVAAARLTIAGIFIVVFLLLTRFKLEWRKYWKLYLLIGVINSSIPFLLYAFAALFIPASLSVVLNSTAPMFGAIFAAVWLGDRLTIKKTVGLAIGIAGVSLATGYSGGQVASGMIPAILACLLAAACYGFAGVFIRRKAHHIKPKAMAGASQLLGGIAMLPLIAAFPPREPISPTVAAYVVIFAVACTGIAYLIYYRLLSNVGPTKALTVTFLMPGFGMLWGSIFLKENITGLMIVGAVIILLGTYLVAVSPMRIAGKNRGSVADTGGRILEGGDPTVKRQQKDHAEGR